jgi:hypothetical protein
MKKIILATAIIFAGIGFASAQTTQKQKHKSKIGHHKHHKMKAALAKKQGTTTQLKTMPIKQK